MTLLVHLFKDVANHQGVFLLLTFEEAKTKGCESCFGASLESPRGVRTLSSVVYFRRGTLPTKQGLKRGTNYWRTSKRWGSWAL